MIVTCEQCQARFKLADEKIKTEGTKVRCSKCQSIFTVFPPPPAPAEPEAADATPPAAAAEPPAEPGPPATEPEQPANEPLPESAAAESTAGGMEFDFGEQEPSGEDAAEAVSFERPAANDDRLADGFDFDDAFSDEESAPPAVSPPAEGPAEFDFGDGEAATETAADFAASATEELDFPGGAQEEAFTDKFDFDEDEPASAAAGEFDFGAATGDAEATGEAGPQEFDFSTESAESAGFGEISFDEEEEASFPSGDLPGDESADFGTDASTWGTPGSAELDSFDFEEPKFGSPAAEPEEKAASLSFGEIDFSDDDEGEAPLPSFDSPPDFRQSAEEPAEPLAPKPPATVTPPRQPASRPRSEAQPAPLPRRSPTSRMVVVLGVLLLALCGAGGYLYMSGDGERLVNQVVMKIKGEKPAGPVEQLISFSNIVTSYVNNREAGQLLVVQGTVTNNFPTPRSAIAVKGLLIDTSGKVIRQQAVYCGNALKEEKLRTLPFAAIEEAMNNQIGDSLSNMNVKPGTSLKFTIVFRNVPEDIANINFEVVDSKPGSS